jgi:hypothetical protein
MQKISVYPPPSTPPKRTPKGRKTDHHNTRARRGSIADQQYLLLSMHACMRVREEETDFRPSTVYSTRCTSCTNILALIGSGGRAALESQPSAPSFPAFSWSGTYIINLLNCGVTKFS